MKSTKNERGFAPIVIVLILALLVITGGIITWRMNLLGRFRGEKAVAPPGAEQEAIYPTTPEEVAENFYQWYIDCQDRYSRSEEYGKLSSSYEYCPWEESEYVSEKLVRNIEEERAEELAEGIGTAGGADPILCAQDVPDLSQGNVTAEPAEISGKTATTTIRSLYSWPDHPITVELELIDNQWKITNVTCPPPPGLTEEPIQLTYKNEEYGFSLTFPETWEGYKATAHSYENIRDVCFSFERALPICIFQIYIHTQDEWEILTKKPTYINENDEFVFSFDYSPECVQHDEFQCERSKEVPSIIETFEFTD